MAKKTPTRKKPKRVSKPTPPPAPVVQSKDKGQAHREKMAQRSRDVMKATSDIGVLPPVKYPVRRESCRLNLLQFLTTYFPESTGLKPFSSGHSRVISRIEHCILRGGRFVEAVYRGWAKSTILENSFIWASVYGHRRFVPLFSANRELAATSLNSIKLELAENDLLFEDFPEVCHPIRSLEGNSQRCKSQRHDGELTYIEWKEKVIVLPTIYVSEDWASEQKLPGEPKLIQSPASGTIVTTCSLMSARGLRYKRPDGTQQRPDFVGIDDPQTDEQAVSPNQVGKRLGIIKKVVLKLGGHRRRIACIMAATVIEKDDVVDQLCDHKRNPAWQSERIKMVEKWADAHETLWLQYRDIRTNYNPAIVGDQERAHIEATAFYRTNQSAMDAGCIVAWEHCFEDETEVSAVQHAYNMLFDDGPEVFASECQNEPIDRHKSEQGELTSDLLGKKLNNISRGTVPISASHLVAHVDVQGKALYWSVCAFGNGFDGALVDYGIWPEQPRRYITLREIKKTYELVATQAAKESGQSSPGAEGALYFALEQLTNELNSREWKRDDGVTMRLNSSLIDANWGEFTDTVYLFCRQSIYAAVLMPSHGRYISPTATPMSEYKKRPGERLGLNWRVPLTQGKRSVRHVVFDTNWWKTFAAKRLATPMGARGCFSLYGKEPEEHRLLIDQYRSEYSIRHDARGRTTIDWTLKPNQDNHFWDNLIGCFVGASMLGCGLLEDEPGRKKKKVSLAALQRSKRAQGRSA